MKNSVLLLTVSLFSALFVSGCSSSESAPLRTIELTGVPNAACDKLKFQKKLLPDSVFIINGRVSGECGKDNNIIIVSS